MSAVGGGRLFAAWLACHCRQLGSWAKREKSDPLAQNLDAPVPEEVRTHPAWLRLEDQRVWYTGKIV